MANEIQPLTSGHTSDVIASDIGQKIEVAKQFLEKDQLIGLVNAAIPYITNFIIALIIFYIGKKIAKWLSKFTARMVSNSLKDDMLSSFFGSLAQFAFLLFTAIAALSQLGVNTSSLVALIGAAGLAIGLSLQNSLQNFAAGVMILIFKPFKKDQTILIGSNEGVVTRIGILMLELRTNDNRVILIPNNKVMSDSITNFHQNPTRRIDLVLDIAYSADIKKAKEVIKDVFSADERILTDPEPSIMVGAWCASSIQIWARPWVKVADAAAVRGDLLERLKYAFDENGIEIPFNQIDVRIKEQVAPKSSTYQS
ncbi:mechanosensitive ion channel family protein [Basilea psittacipulmonis]|uniref:Small-conductance mechanosensitive channel n=1 Tax=Basilea psittacipulmonis DSM 24701 TaxID=1072685 RepID=A0A077DDI0_9BURK|nr:mechanosensitive ion channel domain-containing protein [Basilea psittacipulmonis]AIL32925.1 hypothetical protein IX83_05995 [Basilea psittacipulmonis DSM 24701]